MACYRPLNGFKSRDVNPSGKRSIVFNYNQGFKDMPVTVPCGQCIGCRLERSRQWAIRCHHEASLHERNCFITLTYKPEHLPEHGTLVKKHYQDFMKRLRKRFGSNIRYFHCGEYGEKNARPHYHACLFNFDFRDKTLWKSVRGNKLYTSEALAELWPFGFSTIGDVTFESAAYVARYITKKVTGRNALDHYTTYCPTTGEISAERLPEYTTMSLKPGIGANWIQSFHSDVYPRDEVIMREKKIKPPKYYDKIYDQYDPEQFRKIKARRQALAKLNEVNNTPERLSVRERVKQMATKLLKRSYENET
ncbi:MAG: replication initiator protein [Arizlama microvirus]|nr:MAG: replication initiator protein [Arizlama microvirus]